MKGMFFFLGMICFAANAQRQPDMVYLPNIKTVKLFQSNNQESLPVVNLFSTDQLELHFDDLDGYVKSYYYSFELCNADWTPADLSSFDYLRGYQNQQLIDYKHSSIALTEYVHYQALLPDRNCMPTQSGNYLLRVYLDADTSKIAFTRRFYVLNNKVGIAAQVQQPFNNQLYFTHQKIQFSVNATSLNVFNPQEQIKINVLQNNRWDNAITHLLPSFNRNNVLEYNGEEDVLFPGGKEYRWADLRSFRFQSERIDKVDQNVKPVDLYLKPDAVRIQQRYLWMKDINGWYDVSVTESINPWWQGDYAHVHFTFVPNNHQPFESKEVYITGDLVGNQISDESKMQFNESKGVYENTLLLKQGYYNYSYVTKDLLNPSAKPDAGLTDGNNWEAENDYSIFVYYRSLNGRHDELVAIATVNSRNSR